MLQVFVDTSQQSLYSLTLQFFQREMEFLSALNSDLLLSQLTPTNFILLGKLELISKTKKFDLLRSKIMHKIAFHFKFERQ